MLLADVLLGRVHGPRPVVLIGFGLGARVIFDCLRELAKRSADGLPAAAGVVQHAVLMGLPAPAEPADWGAFGGVVAGRIINCYRPDDMILSVIYRANHLKSSCAGMGPVLCNIVENFDVSSVVRAHHKYRRSVGKVLRLVYLDVDHILVGNSSKTS